MMEMLAFWKAVSTGYVLPVDILLLSLCSLQLRSLPVKPAEDDELEEEAEWIYRNAFSTPTISMQVKMFE